VQAAASHLEMSTRIFPSVILFCDFSGAVDLNKVLDYRISQSLSHANTGRGDSPK
jgi:hypothetical protein